MSQVNTFITIVIPLYNKARHIKNTLQSVLEQTHQEFEIIVVDDGSTDGGGEIVSQINDPRIRLIQQKNGGVSKARNTGIENASHELIAFLDGDDTWLPNHLLILNQLAAKYPDMGIYATSYVFNIAGKHIPIKLHSIPKHPWEGIVADYFKSITYGDNITWSSAIAIKKTIFDEVGLFPVGIRMGEDQDMWLRIALKYPVCFSTTSTAIYNWDTDNRACSTFKKEDFNSPLLTTWFNFKPEGYAENYITKTQLNLLWRLIISGYGKQTRNYLMKIANRHGFLRVLPYYVASYFKKNLFDNLRTYKAALKSSIEWIKK